MAELVYFSPDRRTIKSGKRTEARLLHARDEQLYATHRLLQLCLSAKCTGVTQHGPPRMGM